MLCHVDHISLIVRESLLYNPPIGFCGVGDYWETHPSALTNTFFASSSDLCHLAIVIQ